MMRWYVVHSRPQAEATALCHLTNQGFHCFLPRILQLRSHARQTRLVPVPLFPRYLFVRLDPNEMRWRAINGTRGVVSLLANGPHPLPVPHGLVEALIAKCDSRTAISLTAMDILTKGLRVRIKSGAFNGQVGEITETLVEGRDRVRVLLTLLGATTELQLPSYTIEAA
jgi:transcriptional antiterminator RfaH